MIGKLNKALTVEIVFVVMLIGIAFRSWFVMLVSILPGLFPIVNPVGSAPIFLALTASHTDRVRHELAKRVAVYGFMLLCVSLFVGSYVGAKLFDGGINWLAAARCSTSLINAVRRADSVDHCLS